MTNPGGSICRDCFPPETFQWFRQDKQLS